MGNFLSCDFQCKLECCRGILLALMGTPVCRGLSSSSVSSAQATTPLFAAQCETCVDGSTYIPANGEFNIDGVLSGVLVQYRNSGSYRTHHLHQSCAMLFCSVFLVEILPNRDIASLVCTKTGFTTELDVVINERKGAWS